MRFSNETPQQKIISVADKLGIPGIAKQQGSTRVIYDSLPVDGRSVYRFFEGSNSRVFPFTNVGSFGNKLEVGEVLTVQYIYFNLFNIVDGVTTAITPLGLGAPSAPITLGDWNFVIGNVQVVKPTPVVSSNPAFNKNCNSDSNLFIRDTDLVIPPLLEFISELKTQSGVTIQSTFLRMTIEGIGSLINTRQPY